ncbi:hypothetical protein D3C72_553260 [compost metagenome]
MTPLRPFVLLALTLGMATPPALSPAPALAAAPALGASDAAIIRGFKAGNESANRAILNGRLSAAGRRALVAAPDQIYTLFSLLADHGSVALFEQYLAAMTDRAVVESYDYIVGPLEYAAGRGLDPLGAVKMVAVLRRAPAGLTRPNADGYALADSIGWALSKFGGAGVAGPLVELMQGRQVIRVPNDAAATVAMYGDAGLRPRLRQLLADPRPDRRAFAAEALSGVGDRRDLDALRQASADRDGAVAEAAMRALIDLAPPSMRAVVNAAIAKAPRQAAAAGREHLARLAKGPDAPEPQQPPAKPMAAPLSAEGLSRLYKAATDGPDQETRDAGVAGFMGHLTPAAAPVLWKLLGSNDADRGAILAALALVAPPADDERLRAELAKELNADAFWLQLHAVALRGDQRHVRLIAASPEAVSSRPAFVALGTLDGPDARRALKASLAQDGRALEYFLQSGGQPTARDLAAPVSAFATWKTHDHRGEGWTAVSGIPTGNEDLLAPWQPADPWLDTYLFDPMRALTRLQAPAYADRLYPLLDRSPWLRDRVAAVLSGEPYATDAAGLTAARRSASETLAVQLDLLAADRACRAGETARATALLDELARRPVVVARPDLALRVEIARAGVRPAAEALTRLAALTARAKDFSPLDEVRLPGAVARVELAIARAAVAAGQPERAIAHARDAAKLATDERERIDAWRVAHQAAVTLDAGGPASPRTAEIARQGRQATRAYLLARDGQRDAMSGDDLRHPNHQDTNITLGGAMDARWAMGLVTALADRLVEARLSRTADAAWATLLADPAMDPFEL